MDIIKWGTEFFKKKNISSPRLNIELLMCSLLDINRIEIYTRFDQPLKESELNILRNWVKRRANNEPVEYITGVKSFSDNKLFVDKNVLIPRPETEKISKLASDLFDKKSEISILDIGTGSGCIAIEIASVFKNAKVYAIDIDANALKIAKKNAENLNLNNIFLKEVDILNEIIDYKFDLIVSNPPYIAKDEYNKLDENVKEFEPRISLTDEKDGLTFYRKYADIFPDMLNPKSYFILELGYNQKMQVDEIFEYKYYEKKFVQDFAQIDRYLIGNLIND